jgi:hypothetical protein
MNFFLSMGNKDAAEKYELPSPLPGEPR